jgi:hypothetical protein
MDFLKKLSRLFSSTPQQISRSYYFYVRCNRCGEKLRGRVDMQNDVSISYGDDGGKTSYYTRKVLVGEQRCYQPIEIELTFDAGKNLIDRQIHGGQFIEESEYETKQEEG